MSSEDTQIFYHNNADRITSVVCALIADPDPNKPRMDHKRLVDEAAKIVAEITRRAGNATLPE